MFTIFKKQSQSIRITDFIYQYISKSKRLNIGKKRQYRNLTRHLNDFERQTGICPMSDAFTEQVAEEFILHLRTKKRTDRRARYGRTCKTLCLLHGKKFLSLHSINTINNASNRSILSVSEAYP
ncbi:MAG: phage integrase SAM-like domain-containing protein, partial [Tannerella sp.]|nr:phage integrase SAM-like domain-containing protein [Tannerella sp.]